MKETKERLHVVSDALATADSLISHSVDKLHAEIAAQAEVSATLSLYPEIKFQRESESGRESEERDRIWLLMLVVWGPRLIVRRRKRRRRRGGRR
eukprot:137347-Amorphochlora_amoeboformis.AAC.1